MHCHKVFVQTDFTELVLNAEFSERARFARFDNDFRNGAAETADNRMVFSGDNASRIVYRRQNSFSVDRFNGVHIEDASVDVVVVLKNLRRLNSLIYAGTACDNRDIVAFVKKNGFSYFEIVFIVGVNSLVETAVNTDIEGAFGVCRRLDRFARFDTVCRADKSHIRKRTDNSKVLDCVVGGTRLSERGAAVRTDYFHVDVLIADIGVNLIESTERRKYRKRGREGNESAFRETRRHTVHILFGNTDVDGSFGEFCREVADFG